MILPGTTSFKGVSGTTFDAITTIYIAEGLTWQEPILWEVSKNYAVGNAVVYTNGKAYKCIKVNSGQNPETKTEYWEEIVPLNLTSYTAKLKIYGSGAITLEGGKGLTLGGAAGTIAVEMTPEQTEKQSATTNFSLVLTSPTSKVYEYLKGTIEWQVIE